MYSAATPHLIERRQRELADWPDRKTQLEESIARRVLAYPILEFYRRRVRLKSAGRKPLCAQNRLSAA